MQVFNVTGIYDDDEFVTIETKNSVIHLPMNSHPSITIQPMDNPSDNYTITVNIDLYQD